MKGMMKMERGMKGMNHMAGDSPKKSGKKARKMKAFKGMKKKNYASEG